MPLPSLPALSVVIPCYNEAAVLPLLRERVLRALDATGLSWEIIVVNDGSTDSSLEQLRAIHHADPRFRVVSLSRNFGHQAAITAGLYHAGGDAVAIMDADLQDPPEVLPECLAFLAKGYDVVFAVRRKRKESRLKRLAYRTFYRVLSFVAEISIPLDSGDFCLLSRRVVRVLQSMPERNVFLRGMRAWVGFRQIALEYDRDARAAGETKYPFAKLCRLAADGIFSFSTFPLRLASYLGFSAMAISAVAIVFLVTWRFGGFRFMGHTADELPGWTAAITAGLFLSGIQLLILGFMGEYIGRIYAEVKQRPRWVIDETLGLSGTDVPRNPHPSTR